MDQTVINVEFQTTDAITSVIENLQFAFKARLQPEGSKFRVVLRVERSEDLAKKPS